MSAVPATLTHQRLKLTALAGIIPAPVKSPENAMSSLLIVLILIAVLIIAALGAYAWHLTRQVKEQETRRLAEEAEAEQQLRQHQLSLIQDVHFVCKAVITDQCEITEGVLRLEYLIRGLDPDTWGAQELNTLRHFYSLVREMPILDAYRQLPKKEQFRLDNERWNLEATHKDAIFHELNWLLEYRFPAVSLVH